MQTTNQKNNFQAILNSTPLVLVDFYTEWCGPCKMMKPILEELHQEMGSKVRILKVDVDRNQQVAHTLGIRGVPTLILYKQGEIVWRQSGVVPVSSLRQLIHQHSAN